MASAQHQQRTAAQAARAERPGRLARRRPAVFVIARLAVHPSRGPAAAVASGRDRAWHPADRRLAMGLGILGTIVAVLIAVLILRFAGIL